MEILLTCVFNLFFQVVLNLIYCLFEVTKKWHCIYLEILLKNIHFLDFQNVPNLWSTTVKCQKNFMMELNLKLVLRNMDCNWKLKYICNGQSLIIQIILVSRWRRIIQDWIALGFIFFMPIKCSPKCWLYDAESQGKMAPHFSPIQVKKWPGKLLFDISKPIYLWH